MQVLRSELSQTKLVGPTQYQRASEKWRFEILNCYVFPGVSWFCSFVLCFLSRDVFNSGSWRETGQSHFRFWFKITTFSLPKNGDRLFIRVHAYQLAPDKINRELTDSVWRPVCSSSKTREISWAYKTWRLDLPFYWRCRNVWILIASC